jgi:hypothetical protein
MGLKVVGPVFIALALAACSSQPRDPSASGAAAAPAPAVAPATTSTPAAAVPAAATSNLAPGATAPAAGGQAPVLNKTLIQAGYKAATVKGQLVYCRMEEVTNTAFKKRVCLNEDQLREEERKIKRMQDQMMRSQGGANCVGPACG